MQSARETEPRTGQRISEMPARGDRPGFKRGRHNLPYWIASQVVRDTMDFPDKCIPLPPDADDGQIGELCRGHTARLNLWIEEQQKLASNPEGEGELRVARYDGSMASACLVYQTHPHSRFKTVKANTRKSYTDSLKVIIATVGKRLIRNVTVLDCQHWYNMWRMPAEPGGPERIDRAHDAITMVKTVLRFNAAVDRKRVECKQLLDDLKNASSLVTFEKGGARSEEMTYAYCSAFIRTALDQGKRGVIPKWRGLYMALGVAAQFELGLRPKDIIGERPRTQDDLDKAVRHGATAIVYGNQIWTGMFTWERVPGWQWRMKTSKSKYRQAANFDLSIYSLLFPLLEAVPHEERTGAIVKGEHLYAVQERTYRGWFREIARAADIPDTVWNMDLRSGMATEAEEAGADLSAIRGLLTHSEKQEATTLRYIKRRDRARVEVQKARDRLRKSADNDG
jgi:hypothetical protein